MMILFVILGALIGPLVQVTFVKTMCLVFDKKFSWAVQLLLFPINAISGGWIGYYTYKIMTL